MSEATITIEGFVAVEVTPREAGSHRVAEVVVAHTPRKKDDRGNWVDDGDATWYKATFWDEHADAVLDRVSKGDLVQLSGGLKASTYAKKDGTTAVSLELVWPTIAVVVRKPKRGESGATSNNRTQSAAEQDMWATEAPAAFPDSTPF